MAVRAVTQRPRARVFAAYPRIRRHHRHSWREVRHADRRRFVRNAHRVSSRTHPREAGVSLHPALCPARPRASEIHKGSRERLFPLPGARIGARIQTATEGKLAPGVHSLLSPRARWATERRASPPGADCTIPTHTIPQRRSRGRA